MSEGEGAGKKVLGDGLTPEEKEARQWEKVEEMVQESRSGGDTTSGYDPRSTTHVPPPTVADDLDERLARVRVFAMDVDGVLTDALMYYGSGGEELKAFSTRDGMAFLLMRNAGITPVWITGEPTEPAPLRARKLKVEEVHTGVLDKPGKLDEVLGRLGATLEETAYMGDDLNDLECMEMVAVSFAPSSAALEALDVADIVTDAPGGGGAVREAVERILAARGLEPREVFMAALGKYRAREG